MNFDKCLDQISPSKSSLFGQYNQAGGEIHLIKENVSESQPFATNLKLDKTNSMPLPQSNGLNFLSSNSNSMNSFSNGNLNNGDKNPDDVLMTVTNSMNNNNNGTNSFGFKKSNNFTTNSVNSGNNGISLISQPSSQTITNTSAKKENEKKLWMKRI